MAYGAGTAVTVTARQTELSAGWVIRGLGQDSGMGPKCLIFSGLGLACHLNLALTLTLN